MLNQCCALLFADARGLIIIIIIALVTKGIIPICTQRVIVVHAARVRMLQDVQQTLVSLRPFPGFINVLKGNEEGPLWTSPRGTTFSNADRVLLIRPFERTDSSPGVISIIWAERALVSFVRSDLWAEIFLKRFYELLVKALLI
jgi:hypothetical protein